MEDKHIEIYILIDKVSQEMINDMLNLGEQLEKEGYSVEIQKDVEEVNF